MKFVSWNVGGLRARLKKDFIPIFKALDADIFAVQDIRAEEAPPIPELSEYQKFWNFRSGTAIFSRVNATKFISDFESEDINDRSVTLDLGEYFFVNVYMPNFTAKAWTKPRHVWEEIFRRYVMKLDALKPVIIGGYFNVAHEPIDLKNPAGNRNNSAFRDEDRENFSALLSAGFVDIFRRKNPATAAYTYWQTQELRAENSGCRVDYFLVSKRLIERVADATIETEIYDGRSCPITLTI